MGNNRDLLNAPVDVADDFIDINTNYYFFKELHGFDETKGVGSLRTRRYRRKLRLSFNQEMMPFESAQGWEFPPDYDQDKQAWLSISFFSPHIIRVRILAADDIQRLFKPDDSLSL
jgi:hypothetical protein